MKIAVFSDSHGVTDRMFSAVKAFAPDICVHLGDYHHDALELKEKFPLTRFYCVRGNGDIGAWEKEEDIFFVSGIKILITHGHRYQVKSGMDRLILAAEQTGANLVLFGHTHKQAFMNIRGTDYLNPGASGYGPSAGYAEIEIGQSGGTAIQLKNFPDED